MTGTPSSAYPLAWPSGRQRTSWEARRKGQFQSDAKSVTRTAAVARLSRQVELLGGVYLLISSDMPLRADGQPHLGRGEPVDPGVCAYFQLGGKPYAMACDTFSSVAQNIAAIANHIEATRRIERYGVATAAETLRAFEALPPPGPTTVPQWWDVLGVTSRPAPAEVDAAYRRLATERHPDRGGTVAAMAELNAARDAARRAMAQ